MKIISETSKHEFWEWYRDHQNDKVNLPGVFGVVGLFTKLTIARGRALFEIPFGKKPEWV